MKKKSIIIIIILLLLGIAAGIMYYIFNKPNDETTLTIVENKWIEDNKNKLIDLSIINEVPIVNYNGKGLVFDFLTSLEKDTGLEFNKVPVSKTEDSKTEYAVTTTEELGINDLLLYQDCYAILTKDDIKYNRLEDITDITIGVLNNDLEKVNTYLKGSNVTFKTYESADKMIETLQNDNNEEIDAIVLPKTVYLKEIINNHFTIAYNITDYSVFYVLRLGNTERLNHILNKYYKKWYEENYETIYYDYLAATYFEFKQVDDSQKTNFKRKRYVYGFVPNAPYDIMVGTKLKGYNSGILKSLSDFSDVEISFQEYKNISDMLADFNANKIDLMLDNYEDVSYAMDVSYTLSPYDEQMVILSHNGYDITVHSVSSLQKTPVMVVKNSKIAFYLKANNIKVQEYDNVEKLLEKINKKCIIALDLGNYKYYKGTNLKNYKIDYQEHIAEEYRFIIRNIGENELFIELLNFYLAFANETSVLNHSFYELTTATKIPVISKEMLIIVGSLSAAIVILFGYIRVSKRLKKKNTISKEEKLRYIDGLTSLKNRTYLNDNIEKWDESDVYPQAIIIVDLNNVAYINDNYGHQEGDNVIKEAANILIRGQIENSDIIRTNGNEFLIYLVGYDEKQVIAYNRKLNKELKELSHGFGAASGYSMITDGIKTIDDAVNEATLDMRNNKEELNQ